MLLMLLKGRADLIRRKARTDKKQQASKHVALRSLNFLLLYATHILQNKDRTSTQVLESSYGRGSRADQNHKETLFKIWIATWCITTTSMCNGHAADLAPKTAYKKAADYVDRNLQLRPPKFVKVRQINEMLIHHTPYHHTSYGQCYEGHKAAETLQPVLYKILLNISWVASIPYMQTLREKHQHTRLQLERYHTRNGGGNAR